MNIFLAQQNYHIGNFEANTKKIIEAINIAKSQNADLIVFSELCICGYPPRDFLEFEDFIERSYRALDEIKQHTDNIGVLVGAPARNRQYDGKDLFNAVFLLHEKEIKAEVHKTLLPTYDVFDEYRYFEPAYEWNIIEFKGKRLAVTICEDIWNLGDNPLYRVCPMDMLMEQKPDFMINLSASPFDYTHYEDRKAIIKANVLKYGLPIFYCNTVGSQTEIVFDGGSFIFDKEGNIAKAFPLFEEIIDGLKLNDDNTFNTPITESADKLPTHELNPERLIPSLNTNEIYNALVMGIRDYFSKMGFTKAILGSSGGIDSAVTLALACDALGAENVRAILMPSPYSTSH
ncbi:MAG TPA: nitrilase-related carbon-nitrogen hydrolase, partial [Arachidicoccus sp.]